MTFFGTQSAYDWKFEIDRAGPLHHGVMIGTTAVGMTTNFPHAGFRSSAERALAAVLKIPGTPLPASIYELLADFRAQRELRLERLRRTRRHRRLARRGKA